MILYYKDFDLSTLEFNAVYSQRMKKVIVNAPFSFDIETSTIATPKGKRSFMYIWQFGLSEDVAVYGRTWDEFRDFLSIFKQALRLNIRRYAVVYIHNAGFEFEFLHSQIKVSNVFARTAHHPIYFRADDYCIEFRDSLVLSGLSLEKTAENLTAHSIHKLVGDLDYDKVRTPTTPLTPQEMAYCENDVLILTAYIAEEMQYCGNLASVPLTRTGYARKRFRTALQNSEMWEQWHSEIVARYPNVNQYALLYKCFAGGYVHANADHVTLPCADITSIDFCSSYPAQMIRHKYPLGTWYKINADTIDRAELDRLMTTKAVMCEIAFKGLKSTTSHHIISRSKCVGLVNDVVDNGRIVSADYLRTYITDVDYRILTMYYEWEAVCVLELYTSEYQYLPRPFVEEILNLFAAKTKLKGTDKVDEYQRGKGDLNSAYGMTVTNKCSDEVVFENGEWTKRRDPMEELLKKDRYSKGYFMPYAVGVWVTAWARYELLKVVRYINNDVVYNDTDSIKLYNYDKYIDYINQYNAECIADIDTALDCHDIPRDMARPQTIKGDIKQLGVFEVDDVYQLFKTLGSKRYCYVKDGKFGFTASGIPKGRPKEYIQRLATEKGVHPFDIFDDGLVIPAAWSDKLTHYTFNDSQVCRVTDYMGNAEDVEIKSCCVLEPQPYEMSMNKAFLNFLAGHLDIPLIGKGQSSYFSEREELKIRPYE